jgi:hypothetical protein
MCIIDEEKVAEAGKIMYREIVRYTHPLDKEEYYYWACINFTPCYLEGGVRNRLQYYLVNAGSKHSVI